MKKMIIQKSHNLCIKSTKKREGEGGLKRKNAKRNYGSSVPRRPGKTQMEIDEEDVMKK